MGPRAWGYLQDASRFVLTCGWAAIFALYVIADVARFQHCHLPHLVATQVKPFPVGPTALSTLSAANAPSSASSARRSGPLRLPLSTGGGPPSSSLRSAPTAAVLGVASLAVVVAGCLLRRPRGAETLAMRVLALQADDAAPLTDQVGDLKAQMVQYHGASLADRREWYSPAAREYDAARPRYPGDLLQRVVDAANLSPDSVVLEIGCGPGTATVDLARRLGCRIVCLEPNPDFCALARAHCQDLPSVTIFNQSFEEYDGRDGPFDAILAASSLHFVPPDTGYPRLAALLRDGGALVALWNMELHPSKEVLDMLRPVYAQHAPGFALKDDDAATQIRTAEQLGQLIIQSGAFVDLESGHMVVPHRYPTARYLQLLASYSPYLRLDPAARAALFDGLRGVVDGELGGAVELTNVAAMHVARKAPRTPPA